MLASIMLKDTAFINEVKYGGTCKSTKYEWIEHSLNACKFTGRTTGSTAIVISTPATALLAGIMRTNCIIAPEGKEHLYKLTATTPTTATSNTVTIYGSTTHATCAAGTTFYVIASPKADVADASTDISKARTIRHNFTQVFERGIQIEKSREGIDLYAVADELKRQTIDRTYEVKRELNLSMIWGKPLSTMTDVAQLRTMMGIINYLRDPDFDTVNEDTQVTNVNGALTKTALNNAVNSIYTAGGLDDRSNVCIVTSPKQARVIAVMEQSTIRRSSKEMVIGEYANKFKSDLGFEFDVKVERNFPNDKLLFLDRARVAWMALKGDNWSLEKMAKTGRYQGYQLSGQFTLKVENAEEAHHLLYNLS